ncbi:hypothetical protein A4G18_00670 [Pasteurellaceae bacterium Pebbles2]|nr:hypothetical protein [Pasteurellaceae bacterium Pebbles2]
MNEPKIPIPYSEFHEFIIDATRYRMERHSYKVLTGVEMIKKYWGLLTIGTKDIIKSDVENFVQECADWELSEFNRHNYRVWKKLLAWIKAQHHHPKPHQSYIELPIVSQEKVNAKKN